MPDATPFDFTAEQRRHLKGLVAGMRAAKSVTHGGSPTMMRRPRYSPSRPKHATRPTSTESKSAHMRVLHHCPERGADPCVSQCQSEQNLRA